MSSDSRKIRIAMLVTRMDVGGVPDHVMTLLDGLHNDFEITLMCDNIHPSHQAVADRLGVQVVLIPMRRLIGGVSDWKAFQHLRRTIRDGNFNILHTHMSKAALLGALIGATDRSIKVVNTAHNLGFIALREKWKKAIFWVYDRVISSFGHDATIVVSKTVGDIARNARQIPVKRLHVIQNGIRLTRFDTASPPAPGLKPEVLGPAMTDGVLIICVARLVWFKGLHTLIDALPSLSASHPDLRVLVVGDGELRDTLVAQARDLGVDHMIVFIGERDDIPDLLRISDLFVLPSVSEGLPISLLEAMAANLPLVATSVGGIPELIEEGKTGLLVPSENASALGRAILSLIDNPQAMQQAGRAGRQRLEQRFSQAVMVAKTKDLYLQLAATSSAR